jgi:hypothetical protein
LFTENSSWQSKQPIPHIDVTLYGDCVKMCEDFASNFGDQKNWLLHHDNPRLRRPSSPGNILPKAKWL